MTEDQPTHMWWYHKGKYYSPIGALRDAYPNLSKTDPVLIHAITMIEAMESLIDKRMEDLSDED